MKDLTEHLKQIKIKAIGFDYTDEEECLKAIRDNPWKIGFAENPSKELVSVAIKEEPLLESVYYSKQFKQTEEELIESIRDNPSGIAFAVISKLSEDAKGILVLLL